MTNRKRLVLAGSTTLVLLGAAIVWFAVARDKHKLTDKLPNEQPKTTAELLVGKWKLVKRTPTPSGLQVRVEYAKDGTVTIWTDSSHPLAEPRVESGVYRLEGNTLFRTLIGPMDRLDRNTTIESITEDKLITSYLSPDDPRPEERQFHEFERLREK